MAGCAETGRRDDIADAYGLINSFVVPPVDLAALGQGDTKAGRQIINKMFPDVAANVERSVKELGVTVEQLGVKVTQMSQSIVLQSVEQKLPPPPRSRAPPPKPPEPAGQ